MPKEKIKTKTSNPFPPKLHRMLISHPYLD